MSEEINNEEIKNEENKPEEPPRFEVRATYTKEFLRKMTRESLSRTIFSVPLLAALAVVLLAGVMSSIHKAVNIMSAMLLPAELVLLVYSIILPPRVADKQYEKMIAITKEAPTICVSFCDPQILVRYAHSDQAGLCNYEGITKIVRTKNFYIFTWTPKFNVGLARDGFITGDVEAFEEFLAEKCPQARRNFLKRKTEA